MEDHSYNELARRLAAAAISYRIGNRNIDNVLKSHVGDGPVGEYWQALARKVFEDMAASHERLVHGSKLAVDK